MHQANCWLTLTYSTDPVSICKRDLQLFFKRMRNDGIQFRYFGCGEYGEKLARPHYHICIFGYDFPDKYPWKKSHGGLLYRSDTLEMFWKWGHALISELTPENAGYTARYSLKKITGDESDEHYVRDYNGNQVDVTPEFLLASKQPAIGLSWLQKYYKEVFPADNVIYQNKECAVPQYYVRWLEKNHPDLYDQVKQNRELHYSELEYETGLRILQSAKARDGRTKLPRQYEQEPDHDPQNVYHP